MLLEARITLLKLASRLDDIYAEVRTDKEVSHPMLSPMRDLRTDWRRGLLLLPQQLTQT